MSDKRAPTGLKLASAVPVQIKAGEAAGLKEGQFEAIVSVFGNVDSYGERMIKGAFARTLQERGLPPIYWNHLWGQGPIGDPLDAEERDEGLYVKGELFLDSGDLVRRIYRQMLGPAKTEFSFAFRPRSGRFVEEDGEEIYEHTDVELYEVGPVTVGANSETELLQVASAIGIRVSTASEIDMDDLAEAVMTKIEAASRGGAPADGPVIVPPAGDTAATLALLTKRQHEEA
jgi:uncharacterized protein